MQMMTVIFYHYSRFVPWIRTIIDRLNESSVKYSRDNCG